MIKMNFILGVVSKVFGDLVSKAVSDGTDIFMSAIKSADQNRKSYDQNLQTRLYQITVDALNRFTHNRYKNQDELYDAAERILKGFIDGRDNTESVRTGLKMLLSGVGDDVCKEFLVTLCCEICKDDNSDLYKEIDILWKNQEREYVHGEFARSGQNDREILAKLNDLNDIMEYIRTALDDRKMNQRENGRNIPVMNRADEYARRWDKNVFLNNFNKRDKDAGVNIKLREIYLEKHLPHYKWKTGKKSSADLKELLKEYISDNCDKKMLLILGQPGIGKSTLITWIMANLAAKNENILVYQFASDLGGVNWQSNTILDEIFAIVGLEYNEAEGKTLILDGFDEIYVKGDRERVLHKLNQELEKKNYLKRFSLIITCRENYVDQSSLVDNDYITLQAWDEEQIRSFCKNYDEVMIRKDPASVIENSKDKIRKLIEKKDIMGIPLILYMALALNVDIERSSSAVDIYEQIFSLKRGGIYDRCYDAEHRINEPEIKKHIHRISQQMAFWMFENNADEATISQEKFEEICDNEMRESGKKGEDIQRDILIGNFFQFKYCEGKGTDELQFVHRSIYEYFATVYFYESLCNLKSKEEIAGKLGVLLKDGRLSAQMLGFIKYKFNHMGGYDLSEITKEVFNIMLRDGMTYHIGVPCKNVMERERNIFENMLDVVGLWNASLGKVDDRIIIYLQCNKGIGLNLRGAYLMGANLSGAYLMGANLSGANLSGADLRGVYLSGVYLSGANLSGADLSRADLSRAYLSGVYLSGANLRDVNLFETIFDEDQVNLLCEKYDLMDSRVYISETREIICYEGYCIRKQRI